MKAEINSLKLQCLYNTGFSYNAIIMIYMTDSKTLGSLKVAQLINNPLPDLVCTLAHIMKMVPSLLKSYLPSELWYKHIIRELTTTPNQHLWLYTIEVCS